MKALLEAKASVAATNNEGRGAFDWAGVRDVDDVGMSRSSGPCSGRSLRSKSADKRKFVNIIR